MAFPFQKMIEKYTIKKITYEETKPYLLEIHYAKRMPSISYSFGLYRDGEMCGVITYGSPPSSTLRRGLAGDKNIKNILELNRLCLKDNLKNEASILVGKSLKLLPPSIVISFADTEQGHLGIVYQATNFFYCGLSAKRTDWKIKGQEHLHGQTIADRYRGIPNRAEAIRAEYGDDFYLKPRPRKHRYVYFVGNKKVIKQFKEDLKYKIQPYPKKVEDL